jgi:hypothetical protein
MRRDEHGHYCRAGGETSCYLGIRQAEFGTLRLRSTNLKQPGRRKYVDIPEQLRLSASVKLIPIILFTAGVIVLGGCERKSNQTTDNSSPSSSPNISIRPASSPTLFPTATASLAGPAQRSQKELADAFQASSNILFKTTTPDDILNKLNAVQGVKLARVPNGVKIGLTGGDPVLLLPDIQIHGSAIVKIVITAPAEMAFQLYYLVPGQPYNDNDHMISQSLQAGRNTIYGELTVPELAGPMRIGSGSMTDNCILESVELRKSEPKG